MASSVARINDRDIEYEIGGGGPPCILAPVSWGIDYTLWAHYLSDLERKLTMVYFNPRGIGKSSKITSPSDCSMDSIVSDIERLRKYLNLKKVVLMGHSAGGFSALKYAVAHPENLKSLILIGTAANTDYEEEFDEVSRTDKRIARIHGEMVKPLKEEMTKEDLMRRNLMLVFSVYFRDYEPLKREFEETVANSMMSTDHLTYHQQVDLPRYDVVADLNKIECPVLIIAGKHDPICPPRFSKVIDNEIKTSKMIVFKNSGHWPFIEEKDKFLKSALDFVEGV